MQDHFIRPYCDYLSAPSVFAKRLASGWLMLGTSALALAGLYAILLVVSRTPGLESFFPGHSFFRTALVVHVDQSVVIWFLAFAGLLWSLQSNASRRSQPLHWAALAIAALGCVTIAIAPFAGSAEPLMNNYVPVLLQPLFFTALILFGGGILLQLLIFLTRRAERTSNLLEDPIGVGLGCAALSTLTALAATFWSWSQLSTSLPAASYFEYLFWGGGHIVQFAYSQLLLVAWIWLAESCSIPFPLRRPTLSLLLIAGVIPLLAVPYIYLFHGVEGGGSILAFTELMRYGNGITVVPITLALLYGWLKRPRPTAKRAAPATYRALQASLLLFLSGGVIGIAISGINTVVTAHYHGSIVGITIAFMGVTYLLLPRLGFAPVEGPMARAQPIIYGGGQLLHIGGLAYSGAMGVARKTAGSAQGLDTLQAKLPMAIMGIGGLLAVVGGILFVVVVIRSLRHAGQTQR